MDKTIFLKGGKWSCRGCGDCCRGFSFGPVEPDIIQGLKERKIEEYWLPAKDGWYVQKPQTGEYFFQHRNLHCVFLRPDNYCAIHAEFGSEAKPWFCREFPFHAIKEPRGIAIRVREECSGFHKSFSDGESISSQIEDVLSLPRPFPHQNFNNRSVIILPKVAVSSENWASVEGFLVDNCTGKNPQEVTKFVRNNLLRMAGKAEIESNKTFFNQAINHLIYSFCNSLKSCVVPTVLEEIKRDFIAIFELAQQRQNQEIHFSDEVSLYFNIIFRGRLIGKSFASMGGIPCSVGLFLFEAVLFSQVAETKTVKDIGPLISKWRRFLNVGAFRSQLRRFESVLTTIFWYA